MSVRSTHIRCQGCSFEGVISFRGITLRYHLPDGEIVSRYRVTGWCYDCDRISDIEKPFDESSIQEELLEFTQEEPRGLLAKLFGSGGRKDLRDQESLKNLRLELYLASNRKSPPRCLKCGSDRTVPLVFGSSGIATSFVHKCGGRLYALPPEPNAMRISRRPLELDLDAEGNILSSSDD